MRIEGEETYFFEHWMGLMFNEIKYKRIIDLIIPGSHDCNTNTLISPKYLVPFAKC